MSDDLIDLRDQVSRLCSQMEHNEQRLSKIEMWCASCGPDMKRRLIDLEHSMEGNGRPGLKDRVTSIETKITVGLWLISIVNPIVVGILVAVITS